MGWTIYHDAVADPKAEVDSLFDNGSCELIASSLVGNVHYCAFEHSETDGSRRVSAGVTLIQRSPFGYKDMCESMGPCESKCPRFILEKLSPLPPRAAVDCATCSGTGKLAGQTEGSKVDCYMCDGQGSRDRHDSARAWRKRCWAAFGGEPHGEQLGMFDGLGREFACNACGRAENDCSRDPCPEVLEDRAA